MIDPRLWEFATPTQRKYLAKADELGSGSKAAEFYGVAHGTVNKTLAGLRKRVANLHSKPVLERIDHTPAPVKDGPKKIMVVFDTQTKPGVDFSYLMRMGQYAVEKRPDIIVFIGDHADMSSLSSYDKGKKSFEGRRYRRDVDASIEGMAAFHAPIVDFNAANPPEIHYLPRKVIVLGNHEYRIVRAVNEDPKLEGTISIDDLKYKEFGFEVYPFLEVVVIEGVAFAHYFVSGVAGRPASTAAAQLRKTNMSCVAGHQQGKQIAYATRADGSTITSIICGSCYEHDEDYLGPQGNKHFRGFLMMHEVHDGTFDEMWVSLAYLRQRYPHIKVAPNYAEVPQPEGMR